MRDHWGNPTSPEPPLDERLADALSRYATAFRVLAVFGAIGLLIASYPAGEHCTSESLAGCDETGWGITTAVAVLWISAAVVLLQGFWAATISDAVAVVLLRGVHPGSR